MLRVLLNARSGNLPALSAYLEAMGNSVWVTDASGKLMLGEIPSEPTASSIRKPVQFEDQTLGFAVGAPAAANALALLLTRLAAREAEGRALAAEVLHLYREVHLIEQLSEQLAALPNLAAMCRSALEQAQRLITATHGGILVTEKENSPLRHAASFDAQLSGAGEVWNSVNVDGWVRPGPLSPESRFVSSILERGAGEIINSCAVDPRAAGDERSLKALVCAPLRAGRRTVGVIALASTADGATYSAADLQLLNTIALQTAAAIANSLLLTEMVEAARVRAALAAEFHAASTVQQLLLQSASRPTPGFAVESVYLPASEVGGDFFYVSAAPDGALTAIVGDVAGKGLTAAMRVAMILGVLRRETSHDPSAILSGLNNALIVQGQFGFTTACCIRLSLSGEYRLANAGHIAPYLSGREIATPPALPLGLVADQMYELVEGTLGGTERLVLMSDGVPEARSQTGELYGFERLSKLTLLPANEIAEAAQAFGQEDDITVLTLALGHP